MTPYSFVFFDLDGTLTDPGEGITNSVAHALRKRGFPVPSRASLNRYVGPPLLDAFQDYAGMTETQAERAISDYREYFRDRGIFENVVYDGIPALLARLCEAGVTQLFGPRPVRGIFQTSALSDRSLIFPMTGPCPACSIAHF